MVCQEIVYRHLNTALLLISPPSRFVRFVFVDADACVICMENERDAVFLDCGHMKTCMSW